MRYVLCFNPEEAKRDAEERKAIVDNLEEKIKSGSLKKVLIRRRTAVFKTKERKI